MCVAIYKPAGIAVPSDEVFRKCWETNPDGAGISYINKGKVEIRKGFMKLKEFYNALNILKLREKEESPMFFHFRIATAGNVDGGNTHPFPISSDFKLQRSLDLQCNHVMMHNGVLPIKPKKSHVSDTMEFIAMLNNMDYIHSKRNEVNKVLSALIGSNKLAFMDADGTVQIVGDWSEVDGVLFSNTLWKMDYKKYYYPNDINKYNDWWKTKDTTKTKTDKDDLAYYDIVEKPESILEYNTIHSAGLCPYCGCSLVVTDEARDIGKNVKQCSGKGCHQLWDVSENKRFINSNSLMEEDEYYEMYGNY